MMSIILAGESEAANNSLNLVDVVIFVKLNVFFDLGGALSVAW